MKYDCSRVAWHAAIFLNRRDHSPRIAVPSSLSLTISVAQLTSDQLRPLTRHLWPAPAASLCRFRLSLVGSPPRERGMGSAESTWCFTRILARLTDYCEISQAWTSVDWVPRPAAGSARSCPGRSGPVRQVGPAAAAAALGGWVGRHRAVHHVPRSAANGPYQVRSVIAVTRGAGRRLGRNSDRGGVCPANRFVVHTERQRPSARHGRLENDWRGPDHRRDVPRSRRYDAPTIRGTDRRTGASALAPVPGERARENDSARQITAELPTAGWVGLQDAVAPARHW